jgi:osmotically-inducible protein OsmY
MKYGTLFLLGAVVLMMSGCTHTVQGVQQDTKQNAPLVQAAVQQAGQSLKQAGKTTDKELSANLSALGHNAHLALIGTEIKAKIISDKQLSSSQSTIHVDTTNKEVYLKGHVQSTAQKSEADSVARTVIANEKSPLTLQDRLTVSPG